ncbi:uncharacterized protein LOC110870420 [Helianthus annuus]|uniref:uncharacterized protein LOC110870420 n=1 Tax=Helianthus annuus TaxID=4232 RepID=UPI000B8FE567|nr:uncharacterized protein LOC110870420 [Helianthus annuus]
MGCWANIVRHLEGVEIDGVTFKSCLRSKLGIGDKIMFWKDIWVGAVPLQDRWPVLFRSDLKKNDNVRDRFTSEGDIAVLNTDWVMDLTSVEGISEAHDAGMLLHQIKFSGNKDAWVWEPDKNGVFSVAAVKKWLRGGRLTHGISAMKWEKWLPIKVNFFVWRLRLDRIPTRSALLRRNISMPSCVCPLCETGIETAQHLLLAECIFAAEVWSRVHRWCRIVPNYNNSILDLLNLKDVSLNSKWEQKLIRGVFMITCWVLWKERNNKVFNSSKPRVVEVVASVKAFSFFWFKHRTRFKDVVWND